MVLNIQVGSVVFGNWVVKREIGQGSFGKVFEIQREDFGEVYRAALKVITVPQSDAELQSVYDEGMSREQAEEYFYSVVENVVREFAIMAKLKGTGHVVNYEDHTVIRRQDKLGWDILIRMELLTPLLTYAMAHPFSRRDVIQLGIDLCKALELCQKYNVIHRDIKPENIFVSENGAFKLGDFGIARTIERSGFGLSKKGTYTYMAPEVYRGNEYGFNVDLYSLGLVLYRLLNKNKLPFLPMAGKITFRNREEALERRMSGEPVGTPFYAQGRLGEIVRKVCAFEPKERYSTPAQMRQELEAILYDQQDAELIYPDGDELTIAENIYVSKTPEGQERTDQAELEQTQSLFGSRRDGMRPEDLDASRTESNFGHGPTADDGDRTESAFGPGRGTGQKSGPAKVRPAPPVQTVPAAKRKRPWLPVTVCLCAALLAVAGGIFSFFSRVRAAEERAARFQELMDTADGLCQTEPERAQQLYQEAQGLSPENPAPYVSYAYALYCGSDYEACVSYIEDELALGKEYDAEVQSDLAEILGAAYFELEDYAASASFFRLSTAGGDITVAAMRDYAVALGRLGSVDEANDVLQKMQDAGADDDVTTYVQAEVDYAQQEYLEAERGFETVMDTTEDVVLQKRALRSLAEVYRDCAGLARLGQSPIDTPATKEAELLANGIVQYGLRYDSTLWEMLGLAYFEAYHTDLSVPADYLTRAADCFRRVIELGVVKDYLYANLYTIYYEQKDYQLASQALDDYQVAFPQDYTPHALRGLLLITMENQGAHPGEGGNYQKALAEYEKAGELIRGDDDVTYYQQLGSLIQEIAQMQQEVGMTCLSSGSYEEAVTAFMLSIEMEPQQVNAYLGLADAYIQQREYDKAEETLLQGQQATGGSAKLDDKLAELEADAKEKVQEEYKEDDNTKNVNSQEEILENIYYSDGTPRKIFEYSNGKLLKMKRYEPDGSLQSYTTYEYNNIGNLIRQNVYNPDHELLSDSEYDVNGNQIRWSVYGSDGSLEMNFISEYGDNGNLRQRRIYQYDWLSSLEEYDDNGKKIRRTDYSVLFSYDYYTVFEYNKREQVSLETVYYPDSSQNYYITYEYDDSGKLIQKIQYNSDGSTERLI